jgi:hypothetical protein
MSENMSTNHPVPNPQMMPDDTFEHEDLSASDAMYFMAGLAVTGIVIALVVFGMYRLLDSYTRTHQPAVSPMATAETDTRSVTHRDVQSFPEPRLEESERSELRSYTDEEETKLATYDWVDKSKGVVRIPIDRAMELIVKRGLPVRAGSSAAQKAAAKENAEQAGSSEGSP